MLIRTWDLLKSIYFNRYAFDKPWGILIEKLQGARFQTSATLRLTVEKSTIYIRTVNS